MTTLQLYGQVEREKEREREREMGTERKDARNMGTTKN